MSRSGYTEDYDNHWQMIRWRGAVASAIRGKRGQEFLKEMLIALDAIPTKRLISRDLQNMNGVCALGAVGRQRGMDLAEIDPEDQETVARVFGIPLSLACEIMFENDEAHGYWIETPERRWDRVRHWIVSQIRITGDAAE